MFRSIDTDNSGTLTLEELKHGLAKQGSMLAQYEVRQLMEAVSWKHILLLLFFWQHIFMVENMWIEISKIVMVFLSKPVILFIVN